jgi:hypothetical protein
MTTAWSHAVRGNLLQAWKANAGGLLVAAADLIVIGWLLGTAARGRPIVRVGTDLLAWLAVALVVVSLIEWTLRLVHRV